MLQNITAVQAFADTHPAVVFLVLAWSLVWKGIALWKAARIGHKSWFIALLIINLFGIPEIIYIYFIARKFKIETEVSA